MDIIDYRDSRPVYEQIVDKYEFLILKGIVEKDSQMPSVRQMASDLSVNPNTVQKAYYILQAHGCIYPIKGKGLFVTGNEEILKEKRSEFISDFTKQVGYGRDIGISRDECKTMIDKVYGGDNN